MHVSMFGARVSPMWRSARVCVVVSSPNTHTHKQVENSAPQYVHTIVSRNVDTLLICTQTHANQHGA